MKFTDYLDSINKDLGIAYYNNQGRRFSAGIKGAEVKSGIMLLSTYGSGKTPDEAISDYVRRIAGKKLVFDATNDNRTEFNVPETLEY